MLKKEKMRNLFLDAERQRGASAAIMSRLRNAIRYAQDAAALIKKEQNNNAKDALRKAVEALREAETGISAFIALAERAKMDVRRDGAEHGGVKGEAGVGIASENELIRLGEIELYAINTVLPNIKKLNLANSSEVANVVEEINNVLLNLQYLEKIDIRIVNNIKEIENGVKGNTKLEPFIQRQLKLSERAVGSLERIEKTILAVVGVIQKGAKIKAKTPSENVDSFRDKAVKGWEVVITLIGIIIQPIREISQLSNRGAAQTAPSLRPGE